MTDVNAVTSIEPPSMGLTIDSDIKAGDWSDIPNLDAVITRAVTAAFTAELPENPDAELSILLADNDTLQKLNSDYRSKDKATNILSFAGVEPDEIEGAIAFALSGGQAIPLGDLVLSYSVLKAEAVEQSKSMEDHLSHLLVHGMLHLLGYDHESDADGEVMEDFEREILETLDIKNPYLDEIEHE